MSGKPSNKPLPHNLGFKVVKLSSEDDTMHARDLLQLGPGVRGWACSKYSSYPQELIFQFMKKSTLTKIQLLTHHYMIPTKIEILIGDVQPGKEIALHKCSYASLGDIYLSNNEHTEFKGRELKSIDVSCIGRFLKLVIHGNHMNKLNIHNQVALVAINIIGYEKKSDAYSASSLLKENLPYDQDLAFSMYVDVYVAKTMKQMEASRAEAAEEGDLKFEEKFENAIKQLRIAGEKLGKYEIEKRLAIDNEQFDKAKMKKKQLEDYRIEVYRQLEANGLLETLDEKKPHHSRKRDSIATHDIPVLEPPSALPSKVSRRSFSAPSTVGYSAPLTNFRKHEKSKEDPLSGPKTRTKKVFIPAPEVLDRLSPIRGNLDDYPDEANLEELNESPKVKKKRDVKTNTFHKKKFANIFNSA